MIDRTPISKFPSLKPIIVIHVLLTLPLFLHMHRRGLQCIPKRTISRIAKRTHDGSGQPSTSTPIPPAEPQNRGRTVNPEEETLDLIRRAAANPYNSPIPSASSLRRRSATGRSQTKLKPHWSHPSTPRSSSGVGRRLETIARRGNAPVPSLAKQSLTGISEQEQDVFNELDPRVGVDVSDELVRNGVGSFIELRRYVLYLIVIYVLR